MSVERSKAKLVRTQEGTLGGRTYWVKLPNERQAKSLCFRRIHGEENKRCTNMAGYGTEHVGEGACKFHGGATVDHPNIVSGAHAVQTRNRLSTSIDSYLQRDRDDLLDLTYHLASTRAMFDEFMERFPEPESEDYGIWFHRYTIIIGTLGTLVDKISKMDARNSLTAAQVLYIRACIVDLFLKYIPDNDTRERAIRELASRMGGDVEVEMRPSEIPGIGSGL